MTENRVVALRQKGAIDDPLTEILRAGARRLIAQAVKAEFETFLASTAELVLPDGRQRVVRHGHDPAWSEKQATPAKKRSPALCVASTTESS
jgi:putative transposase